MKFGYGSSYHIDFSKHKPLYKSSSYSRTQLSFSTLVKEFVLSVRYSSCWIHTPFLLFRTPWTTLPLLANIIFFKVGLHYIGSAGPVLANSPVIGTNDGIHLATICEATNLNRLKPIWFTYYPFHIQRYKDALYCYVDYNPCNNKKSSKRTLLYPLAYQRKPMNYRESINV